MSHAKLDQFLPIAFPFGTGDVDYRRSPSVNEVECLQHCVRLFLPQLLEGQSLANLHMIHLFHHASSPGL